MNSNGEEKTIAKAGPLEVFARCNLSGSASRLRIFVTSSVAGWFSTLSPGPTAAGVERQINNTGLSTPPRYIVIIDRFSAIGRDEDGDLFYVSIDGETQGLGTNIFGFRCFAVGNVSVMKLDLD